MESAAVSGIHKLRAESSNCKRIPHEFEESTYICGISLCLRNQEQLAMLARCGIYNKTNMPTKITLKKFVRGIDGNFGSETQLHFHKFLKTCLRIPVTFRCQIVRISSAQRGSAQFGLRNAIHYEKKGRANF